MDTVRVLIVDDSAVVRAVLKRLLDGHKKIEVVGAAVDAQDGRGKIKSLDPDVVTLDIEMPGMNGLEFLEKIMTLRPTPVVMVSTLTQKGAKESLRALQLGAFDVFPKPVEDLANQLERYKDKLHNTVIEAAGANVQVLANRAQRSLDVQQNPETEADTAATTPDISDHYSQSKLLAIGASTGGTEAIRQVLKDLPRNAPGIVIAQHLPAAFSDSFAERLDSNCPLTVKIAEEGDLIKPGHVYVAPGSHHLKVVSSGQGWMCALDDGAPVNRHKPSVDVLFDSVATYAKGNAIGCVLTGMGKDGAEGLMHMKEAGARTLVQDEATSVVWGMPGAAAKLGAAEAVVPLDDVAGTLVQSISGS